MHMHVYRKIHEEGLERDTPVEGTVVSWGRGRLVHSVYSLLHCLRSFTMRPMGSLGLKWGWAGAGAAGLAVSQTKSWPSANLVCPG